MDIFCLMGVTIFIFILNFSNTAFVGFINNKYNCIDYKKKI